MVTIIPSEMVVSWDYIAEGYFFCFFFLVLAPGGFVASVASTVLSPGGSWWLLWLLRLLWLLWLLWLLAPMAHLSSIDQSISEACSPGACYAVDTHPSISLYLYLHLSISLSI